MALPDKIDIDKDKDNKQLQTIRNENNKKATDGNKAERKGGCSKCLIY